MAMSDVVSLTARRSPVQEWLQRRSDCDKANENRFEHRGVKCSAMVFRTDDPSRREMEQEK